MARSRGQIRKRGDERYLIRVYLGSVDGKRKYTSKTVYGDRDHAEKKLTEMLHKKNQGRIKETSDEKLAPFMEEWLESKKSTIAPATYKNYKGNIENHIEPDLGHVALNELNSRLIHRFINDLSNDKGLAPSTVRGIHTTLLQGLQTAIRWELIQTNPADAGKLNLPKQSSRDPNVLSKEQVETFLTVNRGERFFVLWSVFFTGLRPQEALALKWEDLDEDGFLQVGRVVRQMSREGRDYRVVPDAKTESSKRRIKLPGSLLRLLEKHKAEQAEKMLKAGDRYERDGFIFANPTGGFIDPSTVRREFKAALKRAEVPDDVRLYDVRHTHISQLIIDGVDLKKASKRVGHKSIQVTADTYAHLNDEAEREMARAADEAYGAALGI